MPKWPCGKVRETKSGMVISETKCCASPCIFGAIGKAQGRTRKGTTAKANNRFHFVETVGNKA